MIFILAVLLSLLLLAVRRYRSSPRYKGRLSEKELALRLEADRFAQRGGRLLTNLYVPLEGGGTSEIDMVFITRKGLLVIENKNYAGAIYGSADDLQWTLCVYAGKTWYGSRKYEKHRFYNPVLQNRNHIRALSSFLSSDVRMFSLITFSDRGRLKRIRVHKRGVYVCNHASLTRLLRRIRFWHRNVLSSAQIDAVYRELLPLTKVNVLEKKQHIRDVRQRQAQKASRPQF